MEHSGAMIIPDYPALGPFIRSGGENRLQHVNTRRIGSSDNYHIVIIADGVIPYRVKGRRKRPHAPYGLFIQPTADLEITLTSGATWHYIQFDAVHRQRRSITRPRLPSGTDESMPSSYGTQPDPVDLWGVEIPLEIPATCLADAMRRVRWCNLHWWHGGTDYFRSNYELGLLLLDLADAATRKSATPTNWLDQAREYCIKEMVHGVSVNELATVVGSSRQQLRRRLLAECGMTPKEFIDSQRMDEACRLLRTTTYDLDKVSRLCGYSSLSTFSRVFKAHMGISPRKWRQASRLVLPTRARSPGAGHV